MNNNANDNSPRSLDRLLRWMQTVITHPLGPESAMETSAAQSLISLTTEEVEQAITRSKALNSFERLEIYHNAYYARLLDCLREEYSVLHRALGTELFDSFAVAYLQENPSQSYTLARLGERFPDFLAASRPLPEAGETADGDWPALMIDLARLERIVNEVFDGPGMEGKPVLNGESLLQIPVQNWPQLRLFPVVCLRLVKLRFPLNKYFTALAKEQDHPLPVAGESYLAVTRRDYQVRRLELSADQFRLLSAFGAGATLGDSIAQCATESTLTDDELAAQLKNWFQFWTAAGFFMGYEGVE